MELTQEQQLRFWNHVDKTDTCWLWKKSVNNKGYGQFAFCKDGKLVNYLTHRIAYTLTKGEIPFGMFVCHSCDVTKCVNPNHLWLGTQRDNMRDMLSKRRSTGRNGHVTNTKLSETDVREIRTLLKHGMSQYAVAKRFNVGQGCIGFIARKETWTWVK